MDGFISFTRLMSFLKHVCEVQFINWIVWQTSYMMFKYGLNNMNVIKKLHSIFKVLMY